MTRAGDSSLLVPVTVLDSIPDIERARCPSLGNKPGKDGDLRVPLPADCRDSWGPLKFKFLKPMLSACILPPPHCCCCSLVFNFSVKLCPFLPWAQKKTGLIILLSFYKPSLLVWTRTFFFNFIHFFSSMFKPHCIPFLPNSLPTTILLSPNVLNTLNYQGNADWSHNVAPHTATKVAKNQRLTVSWVGKGGYPLEFPYAAGRSVKWHIACQREDNAYYPVTFLFVCVLTKCVLFCTIKYGFIFYWSITDTHK